MAHNKLNKCIHCNTRIVYSRNDEYKSFTKNKEITFIGDLKNECNVEDINFHLKEKPIKCDHVSKNGFVSKYNTPMETSGNTRFLDSAVNDTDTNCNIVATDRPAVLETFSFTCYGNLKYLNLNSAKLNSLPKNMSVLNNLYSLDLSNNYLTDLPRSFTDLHKLRLLNLSKNKFTELPPCLVTGVQILKYINISHNIIKSLDDPPLCLPFLQTLVLSNIVLKDLPVWFWNRNCHLLNRLNLSGNTCFDDSKYISWIKKCHYMYPSITKNVTSLDISNCGIYLTNIDFLNEFKNISSLNIGNSKAIFKNSLMELPISAIANPSKLVELHINDVGLSVLPYKINLFSSLKVLIASHNNLSWLPENFNQLHSLEVLNLNSNKLVMLANGFNKLTHLKELYLSDNQLNNVKKDIEELTNLEVLDIYNNVICEIPISKKHLNNLKSFDIEYNKIDTAIIQETGLMTESDYIKLKQRLRENMPYHRYEGIHMDSSSNFSEPIEDDVSEVSYVKDAVEDEDCYHAAFTDDHKDNNGNGCQSELNSEAKEADWEEEEYWDVHDSDEDWDPSTHDQQKEATKQSYVQWAKNVFNSQPAAFPNYTYCPAENHMRVYGLVRRNLSPPTEHQFDD